MTCKCLANYNRTALPGGDSALINKRTRAGAQSDAQKRPATSAASSRSFTRYFCYCRREQVRRKTEECERFLRNNEDPPVSGIDRLVRSIEQGTLRLDSILDRALTNSTRATCFIHDPQLEKSLQRSILGDPCKGRPMQQQYRLRERYYGAGIITASAGVVFRTRRMYQHAVITAGGSECNPRG